MPEKYDITFEIIGKYPEKDNKFRDIIGITAANHNICILPHDVKSDFSPLIHIRGYFTRIYDAPEKIGHIPEKSLKRAYKTITNLSKKDKLNDNDLKNLFKNTILSDQGKKYIDMITKGPKTLIMNTCIGSFYQTVPTLEITSTPEYWLDIL